MHETKEQLKPVGQTASQQTDDATWQTPACEVVDTALEVTAYSLTNR
ncbi:pyrroloquinoline quinone precursor peptide PqqA [Streptomyces sp. NPDC057623]